jgi:hypothetical protein
LFLAGGDLGALGDLVEEGDVGDLSDSLSWAMLSSLKAAKLFRNTNKQNKQ